MFGNRLTTMPKPTGKIMYTEGLSGLIHPQNFQGIRMHGIINKHDQYVIMYQKYNCPYKYLDNYQNN